MTCAVRAGCAGSVQEALAAQGASYVPGAGPLAGKAVLRGDGADVEMDLSGLAERLWAVELAALHRAAADAAAEERRRCGPAHLGFPKPRLELCALPVAGEVWSSACGRVEAAALHLAAAPPRSAAGDIPWQLPALFESYQVQNREAAS